jgi:hypothetical protein
MASSNKDSSPMKPHEVVQITSSEKYHRILTVEVDQCMAVSIIQWNMKSAGLHVKSQDHKNLIRLMHSCAGTNADIFCFQESLWVPRIFNKHIIQLNTNDQSYTMLGDKQAGIYFRMRTLKLWI